MHADAKNALNQNWLEMQEGLRRWVGGGLSGYPKHARQSQSSVVPQVECHFVLFSSKSFASSEVPHLPSVPGDTRYTWRP